MAQILIIDDDPAICASLSLLLKQAGHGSFKAPDPDSALQLLKDETLDLVIMDMNYSRETSGSEGLELLNNIRTISANIPIILITAWGSIDLAVRGMRAGAFDFINKPWNNAQLLRSIQIALNLGGQQEYKTESPTRVGLDEQYDFGEIIGEDPQLLKLLDTIGRVSATDAATLILGDSGTGKELIAEAIHANSHRRDGPFIKVNLGGISSSLFESEMFGHKRGAFTDAKYDRVGRFEKANNGTIFLDEIGDLDRSSQVKLMRVLQDCSFEVLGSSQTKRVDFRVIAATNRDLDAMVATGEFREDLFYRINLITVCVPALKDRPGDIPRLTQHYIKKLKIIYNRPALTLDPAAISWLQNLNWTGNVRELRNLVERTVLVSPGDQLGVKEFAAQLQQSTPGDRLETGQFGTIEEMEISMIRKAMVLHEKNISKVAESLGLSRAALYRRLEKFGLDE